MSKTMENDYKLYPNPGLANDYKAVDQATEIERLRAGYNNLFAQLIDSEKERDNLRQVLDKEIELVNELREQLAWIELQKHIEQVPKLQPAKPSVVKSTWQAIYNDEFDTHGKLRDSRELCLAKAVKDDTLICLMRADHMSDGTVVVTLESIGDDK